MAYDYVIIGAGMGGLTTGSLLAKAGKKVCVVEAHEYPGGCCHSFSMGKGEYTFCAAVHYIFFCGEGEPVHNFLKKLDLHEKVTFERLDPEGYDIFSCPSQNMRFRIPNGLDKWADRLSDRYPESRMPIAAFFETIKTLIREIRRMPYEVRWRDLFAGLMTLPHILRYRTWTVQDLFNKLKLRPEVQAILATQMGDIGLGPAKSSLLAYAALLWCYGNGAYYPTRHFRSLTNSVARVIQETPGCDLIYNSEITRVSLKNGKIVSVVSKDGREFSGDVFIANMDPKKFSEMVGRRHFNGRFLKKLDYRYSASSYIIYLGVKGIDLKNYGFGKWNIWHYPDYDINRVYDRQCFSDDFDHPGLFLATPTLHSDPKDARICPEGEQILEVVTLCGYDRFRKLLNENRQRYFREKHHIRDHILDIVEKYYIPNLRQHIRFKTAGTPTTHERYLWAPWGNAYGSELTPQNVDFNRLKFKTPIPNLYFTGASAEFPGIGSTIVGGSRLYTHLTGDLVNPGRDPHRLI